VFGSLFLVLLGCSDNLPTAPERPNLAVRRIPTYTAVDLTALSQGLYMGKAEDISATGVIVGSQDGYPYVWRSVQGPFGPLSTPPNLPGGSATAISNDGDWIVGSVGYNGEATVWDPSGQPTLLGSLGGSPTHAKAVNRAGDVVGWGVTASGDLHAFVSLAANRLMTDLGTIPGASPSGQTLAYDINDAGLVVGCGNGPQGNYVMFQWTARSGMVDLGAPANGNACADAVNKSGEIAGWATNPVDNGMTWTSSRGFLFHATAPYGSYAADISDGGLAVGYENSYRAYVADRRGAVSYLPLLSSGSASLANGINACGDAVGYESGSSLRAVLWSGGKCP
jgi:probable HAF family extracellular repeat protein